MGGRITLARTGTEARHRLHWKHDDEARMPPSHVFGVPRDKEMIGSFLISPFSFACVCQAGVPSDAVYGSAIP